MVLYYDDSEGYDDMMIVFSVERVIIFLDIVLMYLLCAMYKL